MYHKHLLSGLLLALVFSGCVSQKSANLNYEKAIEIGVCDQNIINEKKALVEKKDDVIYTGLNAGLMTRNCGDYNASNYFFDAAEESYKVDVDLEDTGSKVSKTVVGTVLSDTLFDYDGSLYERIMVNVYKGLNFMSLNDFENARVEFNRALLRQDKAKDYFASQIEKSRDEIEKAKKDPNYQQNMKNAEQANAYYDTLFKEFSASEVFTNPYATYLASVFFFMDKDYVNAADKFREIVITHPDDKNFEAIDKIFKSRANSVKNNDENYIFLIYEDGMGVEKDSFNLTIPFLIDFQRNQFASTSISFPTLKKRLPSYGMLNVNGVQTYEIANFDNIIATEFKTELPGIIAQTIAQGIVKTVINAAVAKNDPTGGFLSIGVSLVTAYVTKSDIRSWTGLPKTAQVAVLKNDGKFELRTPDNAILKSGEIDKNRDAIVFVRSFNAQSAPQIKIIQR
ncbi:hypothetical protein [Campylobacter sp. RM16187]|uniref:hypothetical protein n=1 Tax=Campylobacter sp. RM16187 TaxID=1660063 RepID=UPI0021B68E82|nr:hypothetical protein [Campylobacter sp. RM16187]QKG29773.1 hypothetical protein CDOMF_1537 [Campylobacter sp. RM16187]